MFKYYQLNDSKYNGLLIKMNQKNNEEFYFDKKNKQWQPIAIMIRYFWPESDTFEMYEELTDKKMRELVA